MGGILWLVLPTPNKVAAHLRGAENSPGRQELQEGGRVSSRVG